MCEGRGAQLYRFCQQCGKLETLQSFQGTKRSCRSSLEKRRCADTAADPDALATRRGARRAGGRLRRGGAASPEAAAPPAAAASEAASEGPACSAAAGSRCDVAGPPAAWAELPLPLPLCRTRSLPAAPVASAVAAPPVSSGSLTVADAAAMLAEAWVSGAHMECEPARAGAGAPAAQSAPCGEWAEAARLPGIVRHLSDACSDSAVVLPGLARGASANLAREAAGPGWSAAAALGMELLAERQYGAASAAAARAAHNWCARLGLAGPTEDEVAAVLQEELHAELAAALTGRSPPPPPPAAPVAPVAPLAAAAPSGGDAAQEGGSPVSVARMAALTARLEQLQAMVAQLQQLRQ
ncbi:hypothetical protein HT031_002183 [Scenedesmus sp. PABB004]|nr:hypothetical protein HT031_002183 [Scenedesmus sp. PABB004]